MHGTGRNIREQKTWPPVGSRSAFECIVEGVPISANNDRRAARKWRETVASAVAAALGDWRVRSDGELSALMVFFHTGPYVCDTDNIPKHVLDAMKGLVFDDDRRITQVTARRTRQGGGFEMIDPPALVIGNLGVVPHFLYVRIENGPNHSLMPANAGSGSF